MNHGRAKMFDIDVEVVASNFCWARCDESPREPWLLCLFVVHIVGDVIDGVLGDDAWRVEGDSVRGSFFRTINGDDWCFEWGIVAEPW